MKDIKYNTRFWRRATAVYLSSALLLTAGYQPAFAETENAMTMVDFAVRVSKSTPDSQLDAKDIELATNAVDRTGLLPDPNLSLTREGLPHPSSWEKDTENSGMTASKSIPSWKLTLTQSFPWPGSLSAAESAASFASQATQIGKAANEAERKFAAMNLFIEMVKKNQAVEVQRKIAADTDALRDIVHERYRQGIGSHLEMLTAQVESARLTANIKTIAADLENLEAHANLLLNGKPKSKTTFLLNWPTDLLRDKPKTAANIRDLTREGVLNSRDGGVAGKKAAYRKSLPSLNVGGMAMQSDKGMRTVGGMLGFQIPLYSFAERSAIGRESDLIKTKADLQLAWYDQRKDLSLQQTKLRISQLANNLSTLEKTILPLVREHVESATIAYGQGKGSLSNIIDSRRELLNFEMARINTSAALVKAHIAIEEIASGFADSVVDQPIPEISAGSMGSESMNTMATSSMKAGGSSSMKRNKSMLPGTNGNKNSGSDQSQESTGTPQGTNGMGM